MVDLGGVTGEVAKGTAIVRVVIGWINDLFLWIINSVGTVEIFFILIIAVCVYLFFNQHNLDPKKIRTNRF